LIFSALLHGPAAPNASVAGEQSSRLAKR